MNASPIAALLQLLRVYRSRRVEALAHDHVVALDSLPDDTMRQVRLIELLLPVEDVLAVELLERMAEGAQQDRPRYRAVVNSIMDLAPLLARLGESRVGHWREVATRERWYGVLALLTTHIPHRRFYAPHQVDVNEQLEKPLGHRKTLARSFNRQVLDRVIYDKHPGVVEIVLNNPRITERDVIKMAAMQPTTEKALHTIFAHPRWSRRYSVKKALVFNPYASISVAQSLLGFLLEQDLQAAAHTRRLAPELRERAKALLAERRERRLAGQGLEADEPAAEAVSEPGPSEEALAEQFLATLPEADLTLQVLELEEEEEELEGVAEDFLSHLPSSLKLVPVGELEDDEDDPFEDDERLH